MGFIKCITKLECKNTAVPQSPLLNIFLCGFLVRFFFERLHHALRFLRDGNNIAIFLTWVGRLNPHQGKIRTIFLFSLFEKSKNCAKIILINIGICRANSHSLIQRNTTHLVQIGRNQCDCGKCIASAWFN